MTESAPPSSAVGALPVIAQEALGDIVSTLADFALSIDARGRIRSVLASPFHGAIADLGPWEGADIRDHLTVESVPKFDAALSRFLAGSGERRSTEVNHRDPRTGAEFPVIYSLHAVGPRGAPLEEGEILMIGRDLRPIADLQQQLVAAQIALENDQEAQRGHDTRYRALIGATREAVVFVALASGQVTDASGAASGLLGRPGDSLVGETFGALFDGGEGGDVVSRLVSAAVSEDPHPVTLTARDGRALRAAPQVFRAAGARILLCRLEEAEARAAPPGSLSGALAALYESGPDAVVLTARDGTITAANDAFVTLVDAAGAAELRGRSLADMLERGVIDLRILLENARRSGRMRLYATRLVGRFESERPVEIAVTHLSDEGPMAFGFAIRDGQIAEGARAIGAAGAAEGPGPASVVELVGSATLREIVAETTDVIEKTCIETAIELTGNNRVAAAEMLGLSRQSLYVKLRKYGLHARGSD